MKTIWVLQHTEAEYLGLMEDHFEGRNLRFRYFRPFAAGGMVPEVPGNADGLILLGGGPYGVVSGHILPSLGPELRLTRAFLAANLPVIGFEMGALILLAAAGGGVEEAPLRFEVVEAISNGFDAAPQRMPLACYLRDRPVLRPDMPVLMQTADGAPAVFAVGAQSIGLIGHPGMKRGMAEDLVMEFGETPEDTLTGLDALGAAQMEIAEALGPLMVALVRRCGWM
jgi:GMP synthase-like glutamine amidotransferase